MDEQDGRPWEEPGQVRRDCEPHRGPLLQLLGVISLVCGLMSICFGVSAVLGLPLGVTVTWLARRDLARMNAGLMGPQGATETNQALDFAYGGCILSLIMLLLLASIVVLQIVHSRP